MTPGTILTDTQFLYSDGTTGKKILIVLNDGEVGHYIVIKTTSKDGGQFVAWVPRVRQTRSGTAAPGSACER